MLRVRGGRGVGTGVGVGVGSAAGSEAEDEAWRGVEEADLIDNEATPEVVSDDSVCFLAFFFLG